MTSHQQHERGRAHPGRLRARRTPTSPSAPVPLRAVTMYLKQKRLVYVVGYFIAKYAKMPFLTVTSQVVYNEINHLSY